MLDAHGRQGGAPAISNYQKQKNKCSTKAPAVECGVGVVWKSKHGVILPIAYASTLACMKK